MKLRTEILVVNLSVIALLVVISVIAYRGLTSLNETAIWVAHTHEVISEAQLIQRLVVDMETGERGFLIAGKEEFLEPYDIGIKRYIETRERLRGLVSDNPVQVTRLQTIDELVTKWKATAASVEIAERRKLSTPAIDPNYPEAVANSRVKKDDAFDLADSEEINRRDFSMQSVADLVQSGVGKTVMDSIRDCLDEFIATEEELLSTRREEADLASSNSVLGVVTATLLAIAGCIWAMVYVSRSIQKKIGREPSELARVTEQIAKGQLDIGTEFESSTGIAASIGAMVTALKEKDLRVKEQDWLKTSVAHLNDTMRGQMDIPTLSELAVSEISTYLGAQVSVFYRLDDDAEGGPTLSPVASYAYAKRRNQPTRFKLGEALVGQCALDKQQIVVRNVPEDYLKVSSGLGEATPKFVTVTPCLSGERLSGVIEIGAFDEFSNLQLEYLALAMAALAVSLRIAEASGELEKQNKDLLVEIAGRERLEKERRELEIQYQQAKKLESLGLLAGGVAHDFNNLLVGILGNTELAREQLPEDSLASELLADVELSAQRATEVTSQLLAYSGRSKLEKTTFHLASLAEEIIQLLRPTLSKKAVVKTEFAHDLPAIEGDPSQIRQLIMNLLTNASDALGDKNGEIRVTTEHCTADEDLDGTMVKGDYSVIEISDTGCGMDAETQERIFDPFFSTHGLGRGLGLAALQGIVKSHDGYVRLESKPGKGTTFSVFFPASSKLVQTKKKENPVSDQWTGSGTVLVVDDEAAVRKFAERGLTRAGFEVLLAADGVEAVEIFRERSESISLVLLDLTMPRMDGKEALQEIRQICTSTPVILTSGFNSVEVTEQFSDPHLIFLQKPYRTEGLLEKLREALNL